MMPPTATIYCIFTVYHFVALFHPNHQPRLKALKDIPKAKILSLFSNVDKTADLNFKLS